MLVLYLISLINFSAQQSTFLPARFRHTLCGGHVHPFFCDIVSGTKPFIRFRWHLELEFLSNCDCRVNWLTDSCTLLKGVNWLSDSCTLLKGVNWLSDSCTLLKGVNWLTDSCTLLKGINWLTDSCTLLKGVNWLTDSCTLLKGVNECEPALDTFFN